MCLKAQLCLGGTTGNVSHADSQAADARPLLCLLSGRSPARSPAAGPSLHRSTEDLRIRQSASYGRLCECVLGSRASRASFHRLSGGGGDLSRILRTGIWKKSNLHPQTWAVLGDLTCYPKFLGDCSDRYSSKSCAATIST